MRKAVVKDGVVVNVIEWEEGSTWKPPEGAVLLDALNANVGDVWDGKQFKPRPPTPEEIVAGKRQEALDRAVQAILANAGTSPWGRILKDLAIAQGWVEPD
jgi:hypothetical protein